MSKSAKVHKLQYLHRDRGYRFAERDPAMIELCNIIHQSEMSVPDIQAAVYKATGGAFTIGNNTIYHWLNGKTKRPSNHTLTWVGYALGYTREWTRLP